MSQPKFRIERSRNRQWTSSLVAGNGETVAVSEQFTTLAKAEESLFHVVDEVHRIIHNASGGLAEFTVNAIPYDLSVAYTRGEREYEPRVAHRSAS